MHTPELEKLKDEVFARRQVLKDIYQSSGSRSLYNYANSWNTASNNAEPEFFSLLEKLFGRLHGAVAARGVVQQIRENSLVSTIDHHGIFGHSFFLNSNLIFALRNGLKFLPVLSTSGVSLNNSSWPGSLLFTNYRTQELVRHSFFKESMKTRTVFGAGPIEKLNIEKVLQQLQREDFLLEGQKQDLIALSTEILTDSQVQEQVNFSDQAAIISRLMWQRIFPQAPQLLYLPLEDLVGETIVQLVLPDSRHTLYSLMFTKEGMDLLEKYFLGVRGAFGHGRGSFLFWQVNESGRRVSITRKELERKFNMDPEAMATAILNRTIYPTSLLCFLILLHYQISCLGGFNQTSWLTEIKRKFILLLEELGKKEAGLSMEAVPASNFAETTLAFSYRNGQLAKPAALDLYMNKVGFNTLQHLAKKISLAQSLESELPEIYKIVVPAGERKEDLGRITAAQIAETNGLTGLLELL